MEETIYSLVRTVVPMAVSAHEQGQNDALILAHGLALTLPPSNDGVRPANRVGFPLRKCAKRAK